MLLNPFEIIIMIIALAAGTMITRFTPFLLFPEGKTQPAVITWLGKALPPAMMGLLVIYCLRHVSFTAAPHGLPEFLAIGAIALVHLWRRNVLLSIGGGTVLYMILVQLVFA
ncbi:MAG TPA: branched-chain amino acid transporter AzlD [Clostridiales bacterium]|jgi:branched-subunit amino acid transport protein AzlD|nr:branched-chain amino acid transporter AzlD [Clostridiales bacterium]